MTNSLMSELLFIVGIGVFGGLIGAIFFQKFKIPQVLGYITAGIILGKSGFNIIKPEIPLMKTFSLFALGIIGFMVGGEIKFEMFKKYGKQITTILLAEGIFAFILVSSGVGIYLYYMTGNLNISIASAIIFGAIASATDPASTIEVLWEYRTAGIVTTTIIAIIALDDALAMSLYAVGTSVSQLLLGDSISVSKAIFNVLFELTGAVGLGILAGLIIHFLIRHFLKKEKSLVFTLGILLILMGIAHRFDMDIILASMSCGIFLSNSSPKRSSIIFEVIKSFSAPIYVLFFALVGARLVFNQITIPICIIVGIYVLGRNFGKYTGTVAGGYITKADKNIVAYSGMGLFCQGGVAIGLSIVAGQHFTSLKIFDDLSLSDLIVSVITATTFFSQIIGPLLVKFTAKISGEIDKNITEDDILEKWKTEDVAITKIAKIKENEPVTKAISLFKDYNNLILPVIDNENKIKGSITLENLKDILTNPETWQWIVASDVATPITNIIQNKDNLKKVYEFMCETNISQIPIVKNEETLELSGILDVRHIKRSINNEIIKLKIT